MSTSLFTPKEYVAPAGNGSKTLDPGQVYARIADVKFDSPSWDKKGGTFIVTTLEGPAIEGFEGFKKDVNEPGLGTYEGKIATVKSGNWSFADFTPNSGPVRTKDEQLKDYLDMMLTYMGKMDAVVAAFGKQKPNLSTIEDYLEFVKPFLIDPLNMGYFTLIGEPYQNNKGNTNMAFFFPRRGKDFPTLTGKVPMAKATQEGEIPADLFALPNPADYIKQPYNKAAAPAAANQAQPVSSFGGQTQAPIGGDDDNDLPF